MSTRATATATASTKPLTIVITGASRGLGLGMAKSYLEKGHKLGLCSRSDPPQDLELATKNYADRLYYQSKVDVGDPTSVRDFLTNVVNKFGTIDVWINNAGILQPIKPIRDTQAVAFQQNIQTNLMGVFYATQAYIQHVRNARSKQQPQDPTIVTSTLINISSGAAIKGYAGWGAYCASKAAVDRLTECALLEEQENETNDETFCFRAYSIAPGLVDTDMQATIRATSKEDFPMLSKFLDAKTNDSFNSPEYVAREIEKVAFVPGRQTGPVVMRIPSER